MNVKTAGYILAGLVVEIVGVFTFANIANLSAGPALKFLTVLIVLLLFVILMQVLLRDQNIKAVSLAFAALSVLGALALQTISILFYPGIFKDLQICSLENLKIIGVLILAALFAQFGLWWWEHFFRRKIRT